ncbi:unnamed protein product (macronuclear) [Paramecium tetraurelia]|uniref:Cyclic nucleotide-binding domain-containing protein n=1 Tax=Paramecium tetraurelia TaxID=5888 RepID=A0E0I1_PARTE|nr:uncharacterized protein GSPATT00021966001 [Paramecium tetraurelia]CAK88798.1 unnamed protein product [Paramecium tetraurelia]|eukprot:XP_001456195.1 hypothetical protein (macronuclear) [Paramecium tetraurelia strain d4-2]
MLKLFRIEEKLDTENQAHSVRSLLKSFDQDQEVILRDVQENKQSKQIDQRSIMSLLLDSKNRPSQTCNMGPKIRAISFQSNKPMMNLKEDSPVFIDSHTDHVGFSNKIWRTKALEILMITLRFISFITKSNFATSFKLINKNVFEIIGDVSADFTYYLLKNFFKYEKPTGFQKGQHFLNQTLLIPLRKTKLLKIYCGNQKLIMRPESLASIWWNIYILTILNINVLYVSIKIAFKFDEQSQDDFYQARQIIFDVLPSYSFMLEILLKFNTCYYYKGAVIENRYQIAKNYLRSSFFFDIFVVIPYFISLRFDLQYLDLVIILKVFQITKFSRNLFDRLELTAIQIVIVDLVKLGYTILAAAHFSACIWFLVGSTGNPNDTSWIKAQNIENEQWFNQYLHSLYWSIITMTTIGYGDITPQNLRERVFAVGMALSAVGVFGYSIGNINSIYAEWSRQSFQIRTDMNNLKKFIRIKGINKHLAEKIRKYFEYVWSDQMEDNDREVYKFSEMIPKQLAEEMKIDTNMKLIQKNSFLVNNFSEQFLISLSKVLIEEKYVPESTIYLQNDPSNYLYILSNGSLSFYITLNNKQQTIKVLETIKNEGQAFGVLEFFQSQAYQVSCKSNQFSYVLKIDKSQFMEIISQHKNDYYKYCELVQQISFMNQQELVDVTCRACNKSTHIILECPYMVCGYPNRSKVLLNYRRNVPSDRVKYARKLERKIQTRREQSDIQNSIYLYMCKTQMLKEQIDQQHYSAESYDEGASVVEDGNDEILEHTEKADKELKSNALLAPLRTQMTKYQLQRKLSFQACTDALQDDEIVLSILNNLQRNRILEIINQIQKAERSNKYQSRFNQGSQQVQPYLRIQNHQNSLLSNKSIQDLDKRTGEYQRGDQKKTTKQVAIKVNDFSIGQLYANRNLDEDPEKRLGQYLDIFEGFEKVRNFEQFLKHNNANEIARLQKVNKIQRKHKQTN